MGGAVTHVQVRRSSGRRVRAALKVTHELTSRLENSGELVLAGVEDREIRNSILDAAELIFERPLVDLVEIRDGYRVERLEVE